MSPWHLRQAARCVAAGGIIAYPTEAVYGLGCDPLNAQAVFQLLGLKQRSVKKGLILIGATMDHLEPYMDSITPTQQKRLDETWPGPLTWLIPAATSTPGWLTGGNKTIALRLTDHPTSIALCNAIGGALVSTSANPHGLPPARNPLAVYRYFADQIDYVLNAPTGKRTSPSEIRDLATEQVVRNG